MSVIHLNASVQEELGDVEPTSCSGVDVLNSFKISIIGIPVELSLDEFSLSSGEPEDDTACNCNYE